MLSPKFAAIAAAALAAAVAAAPAHAQDADKSIIVVPFDDLNLHSPAGLEKLDARLRLAARKVCDSGSRSVAVLRRDNECREHALAGARTEVAAITRRGGTEVALRR